MGMQHFPAVSDQSVLAQVVAVVVAVLLFLYTVQHHHVYTLLTGLAQLQHSIVTVTKDCKP